MCIILTCESGIRPDHELVETCFFGNPDGAGIMWCEDGSVQISKGFMEPSKLIQAIESTPIESPLVIHMRIATSGGIDVGTCHPFPVCHDLDILHASDVECDVAVAHNGVIKGMETNDALGISDTVTFVSEYMTQLYQGRVTDGVKRRMREIAPGNRFAVMTSDGGVYRVGHGWESVTDGIEASNSTWRWSYEPLYLDDFYGDGDMFGPEYDDVFDMCCGDCKYVGTCMKYGPVCDEVYDAIAAWDEGVLTEYGDMVAIA